MSKENIIFDKDLGKAKKIISGLSNKYSSVIILTDKNCDKECLPLIEGFLPANLLKIVIDAGEESKSDKTFLEIIDKMLAFNADRNSVLVNLGGGMITDLGGFVASVFKRGIDFIHIPTSMLGIVDAAIGGKNGINYQSYKNQIGTINLPEYTIIHPGFLATLPEKEWESGLGEVFKYSIISEEISFENIKSFKNTDSDLLNEVIKACINCKSLIVDKDPYEKNLRKILNLGHTIGHALEGIMPGQISHGKAVAAGILIESKISQIMGHLNLQSLEKIHNSYFKVFGKIEIEESKIDQILTHCKKDKKNISGAIKFALPSDENQVLLDITVDESLIVDAIQYYINL